MTRTIPSGHGIAQACVERRGVKEKKKNEVADEGSFGLSFYLCSEPEESKNKENIYKIRKEKEKGRRIVHFERAESICFGDKTHS